MTHPLPHTPNPLAGETSPYLLQHAGNPVYWYPWGETALALARDKDLPILLSIGYSACHWCHVMERESFEDPEVAAFMNQHFINIKVDREERPDLDHIYMEAVQVLTGQGGWPLNVFLTPEARPFFGGTYFPPRRMGSRVSWGEILAYIQRIWTERRPEAEQQADRLLAYVSETGNLKSAGTQERGQAVGAATTDERVQRITETLMASADRTQGGFGQAPKFPQFAALDFLLYQAKFVSEPSSREHALHSLRELIYGGITDQLGGGLCRYSTDAGWLAPHFEKMLYDNALFMSSLALACQVSDDPVFRRALQESFAFCRRELKHPEGGYYAALDADSNGEEGLFYTWEPEELQNILGERMEAFQRYYDIQPGGNWEGRHILRVRKDQWGRVAEPEVESCSRMLFEIRTGRQRPGTDDKILLGWNSLIVISLSKGYQVLGDEEWKKEALGLGAYVYSRFRMEGTEADYFHSCCKGVFRQGAFLDDLAYLTEAFLWLHEISADTIWLFRAKALTEAVFTHFSLPGNPLFSYTDLRQEDAVIRKPEFLDSATPSGNAVMACNIHKLARIFDRFAWREWAEQMWRSMGPLMNQYPLSVARWCQSALISTENEQEIVVLGKPDKSMLNALYASDIPGRVLVIAAGPDSEIPVLAGRSSEESGVSVYVCRGQKCAKPVNTLAQLAPLLQQGG